MVILFNKPYGVLCQFRPSEGRLTLGDFIAHRGVHAAGRLDADSEGLLVLTDDGREQHRITDPRHKLQKTYFTEVEREPTQPALTALCLGVNLADGMTRPAEASIVAAPAWLWPRNPPVRFRKYIPTAWIKLAIHEGRNRQVRRMTAAVGYPTLRLIRYSIGNWTLDGLAPGHSREIP